MRRAYGAFPSLCVLEYLISTLILSTSDLTLPQYYVMNYCILIACASDDWSKADLWRLCAEHVWSTARTKAVSMRDHKSLEVLDEARLLLDTLEEQQLEDTTGLTKEEREAMLDEDMVTDGFSVEDEYVRLAELELLEDVASFDSEDQTVVKNADEVPATQLPFRPSNGHASETS
jgi:hypothetical protein